MARRKPTARRRNSDSKRNVSVEVLIALAEQRLDSPEARKAFDEHVSSTSPGTIGAVKLVRAADAIEDEDLLLDLARKGFLEAFDSHTLRRRVLDEANDAVDEHADRRAAQGWSAPDENYPDAWTIAEFGSSVAVNGELLGDDDKIPERPDGFVLTNFGGSIPETEVTLDPRAIAPDVASRLNVSGRDIEKKIGDVLAEDNPGGIPVSVSGETEVWMDPDKLESVEVVDFEASAF